MKPTQRNNLISCSLGIAYQIIQFHPPECLAILYNPENLEMGLGKQDIGWNKSFCKITQDTLSAFLTSTRKIREQRIWKPEA